MLDFKVTDIARHGYRIDGREQQLLGERSKCMLAKCAAILFAAVLCMSGRTAIAQAETFKRVIPVTKIISCVEPCKGSCVFQDTFVIEIEKVGDKLVVTSLEDFFSRTTVGEEVEGHQCKTERKFGRIIVIDFEAPDGTHKTCTSPNPEALAACGIKVINSDDSHRPAAFERKGKASGFKFKYIFKAQCICDDKPAPEQEVTIDLVFKDGKFLVAGKEFK